MSGETDRQRPGLPPGYDGKAEAKQLLRTVRAGALATLSPRGFPFSSLVNVATDPAGAPILLMSQLAAHTKHLDADPRASILLARTGKGDPLAHPRLTLVGQLIKATLGADRDALKARFLARHPKSALYADFADFSFWRMSVETAHLNGGFAKAADYVWSDLAVDMDTAQGILEIEASALEHLNNDHVEALSLYAEKLAKEPAGRWRATGLDPEGLDIAAGDLTARISFPEPVRDPASLRRILAELSAQARAL
jgi:putative heme iron utilization protein